ncbi:SDR family oxidoreductase [Pleionea sediminis]|uniref:SDR family oxidoreductase n=1 Tax=Pleionea sediminis TaxID=2569479 RepID=UPI00118672AF|nr:SDR family oxidoreductase [Pleionea sediminis]
MSEHSSKIMLITGASSGIGEATARTAAKAGLRLILTARRGDLLEKLATEIGQDKALAVPADITNFDTLKQVVAQGVKHFGGLDVVFANAGTGTSTPGTENGDPAEWQKMIDLNINALLYTAKLTLPHLRKSTGHFIMTGSVAGKITLKGSIYGATKWFVQGFGNNLAEEMREWNGRCTTIAPGMVNTPFFDEPKPNKLDPQDVADAVMHAINANPRNNVREVFLMPRY